MRQKFTLVLSLLMCVVVINAQGLLNAAFTADQTEKIVYKQGFDSQSELTGWTLSSTNSTNTWKLGNPQNSVPANFSTIEPSSVYSLLINYDDTQAQDEKYASPVFAIKSTTQCKFYAAFDGVFSLYAPLKVFVEDQADMSTTEIFNSFMWSQNNAHERPKWLSFEFDLSEYVGKNIRIIFSYKGKGGDDVLIDDFCIVENDNSDEAKVNIFEGNTVNFKDTSEGNPTSWLWSFEGGTPSTSTEQNPKVVYNTASTYNVTLTVADGTNNSSITKTDFVKVQGLAPVAAFNFPSEGYLSPDAAIYLPTNTLVTYIDKSKNIPTAWSWYLPGTKETTYTDQNATVIYSQSGTYAAALTVTNSQGSDIFDYANNAVQVGDSAHIWNIGIDESGTIGEIALGWYGFYGGSNWLDMTAFAERYKKPAVNGHISAVDIYFSKTTTIDTPVDITVTIRNEKNGLPGDILATSVLSSDKLAYDSSTWLPTTFKFDSPVAVDDAFYVAIAGIPNRTDDEYNSDEVVMGAVRRTGESEMQSTVYHYGVEYGNEEAGEVWLKNSDENISFAITPLFAYDQENVSIDLSQNDSDAPTIRLSNGQIIIENIDAPYSAKIYNTTGVLLNSYSNVVAISTPQVKGLYILRIEKDNSVWSYKINF